MSKLAKLVGKNVADQRKRIGITQATLAERVGVAVETIGRLERGASQPSFGKMCEIAETLGADIGFVVGSVPPDSHAQAVAKLTSIARSRSVADVELLIQIAESVFLRLDER